MSRRPFEELIDRLAREEGVPAIVAQAYADTENAGRDPTLVMDRDRWGGGSYGLFQITHPTAREYGYTGNADGLKVPENSARYGLRYLRAMYNGPARGSWSKAAAAYNAGPDMSPWPAAHVARFEANVRAWEIRRGTALPPDPTGGDRGELDGRPRGGGADSAASVATAATTEGVMPDQAQTGKGTGKRAFWRALRGIFVGGLSLWAAKKGVTIPPEWAGPLGDTLGQAINVGVALGADKAIREVWGRWKK